MTSATISFAGPSIFDGKQLKADLHRPASETPFKNGFDGGPTMYAGCVTCIYILSHLIVDQEYKHIQ